MASSCCFFYDKWNGHAVCGCIQLSCELLNQFLLTYILASGMLPGQGVGLGTVFVNSWEKMKLETFTEMLLLQIPVTKHSPLPRLTSPGELLAGDPSCHCSYISSFCCLSKRLGYNSYICPSPLEQEGGFMEASYPNRVFHYASVCPDQDKPSSAKGHTK